MITVVDNFNDKKIEFDSSIQQFICGEYHAETIAELKRELERASKEDFNAEFLLKDSFDGIVEFTGRKRYYSDYNDKWVIRGEKSTKYGSSRDETVNEEDLYPKSEGNLALLEKQKVMEVEGWKLINNAKALRHKLKK